MISLLTKIPWVPSSSSAFLVVRDLFVPEPGVGVVLCGGVETSIALIGSPVSVLSAVPSVMLPWSFMAQLCGFRDLVVLRGVGSLVEIFNFVVGCQSKPCFHSQFCSAKKLCISEMHASQSLHGYSLQH